MEQAIYVHELKFDGNDEFSKRFNYVSWLWQQGNKEGIPQEEQDKWYNLHFEAKLALEQGYPMSFIAEYPDK